MVGNNIVYNDQNNTTNDIIKFILNFHEKSLDIEALINKFDDEKKEVIRFCQNFLYVMFIDGENYFLNSDNFGDKQLNDNENTDYNNFEEDVIKS